MPVIKTLIETMDMFTKETVKNNPNKLFVFGDNMLKYGRGEQSIIRDLPNTLGITIKRTPRTDKTAYFSDANDEMDAMLNDILKLCMIKRCNVFTHIVFPTKGIGTGGSCMKSKSPVLYKTMKHKLETHFNYTFEDGE
jgi:hypothetical protein